MSNLKGHMTIELTNTKTGEVQTIEQDNIVTKAAEKLIQPLGCLGRGEQLTSLAYQDDGNSNRFNQISYLTKGLMLLNENVEENENLYSVPAGIDQIAGGSYRNNTTTTVCMGNYDANNSGVILNDKNAEWDEEIGFKHIWNFTEEQGNGTFKCACLTTYAGGIISDGMDGEGSSSNSNWYFGYDERALFLRNKTEYVIPTFDLTGTDRNIRNFLVSTNMKENQLCVVGDQTLYRYCDFFPASADSNIKIPFYYYHFPINATNIMNATNLYGDNGFSNNATGNPCKKNLIKIRKISMPTEIRDYLFNNGSASNFRMCCNIITGIFYFSFFKTSDTTIPQDTLIYIWKINPWTKESTVESFSTPFIIKYGMNVNMSSTNQTEFKYYCGIFHLDNGYSLIVHSSTNRVYLIKRNDTTDITELKIGSTFLEAPYGLGQSDASTYASFFGQVNMMKIGENKYCFKYHYGEMYFEYILDCKSKKIKRRFWGNKTAILNTTSGDQLFYPSSLDINEENSPYKLFLRKRYGSRLNLGIDPVAMITINNLDQPVTKTKDYTMKITYSIVRTDTSDTIPD